MITWSQLEESRVCHSVTTACLATFGSDIQGRNVVPSGQGSVLCVDVTGPECSCSSPFALIDYRKKHLEESLFEFLVVRERVCPTLS